jgi:hypothetical protein
LSCPDAAAATCGQKPGGTTPNRGSLAATVLRLVPALLILALGLWPAAAEERSLVPSLRLRQEYNDNIFFGSRDEIDDFRTIISPRLELGNRTERLNANLIGQLDGNLYADNTDLNAVDQLYSGGFGYRLTPRMGFGANAGYSRDNQPDRELLETGLLFSTQPRETYRLGASGDYRTGENTAAQLSFSFERQDFEERSLSDSEIYSVSLLHTWAMSRFFRETVGRINLGYAHGDFSTSEVDSYSLTLGAEYAYSELWSVLADVGVRYTRTEFLELVFLNPFVAVVQESTDSRWSGVVDVSLAYNGEYSSGRITLLNDVRQASGRGGTVLRSGLNGSFSRRFTEDFSVRFSATAFRNKTVSGLQALSEEDSLTVSLSPRLGYAINRDWSLAAGYRFSWIDDREAERESKQNVLFAEIYCQYPLFE